jgi:CheY-like chemotaxis protein
MSNLNSRSTPSNLVQILLVDDNRNGLMARKAVLAELGYRITTATRPTQALEAFRSDSFDLVITDYNMPEMKGVELIHHLRAERPAIPVILISGYVEALGLNEANTRADAVIQKSANEVSHLVLAVSRLLRRKAPRKPANAQASSIQKPRRKSKDVS